MDQRDSASKPKWNDGSVRVAGLKDTCKIQRAALIKVFAASLLRSADDKLAYASTLLPLARPRASPPPPRSYTNVRAGLQGFERRDWTLDREAGTYISVWGEESGGIS